MEDFVFILLGSIFNPIYIIIIVVVFLIVSDNRKKNRTQSEQQRQITEGVAEGDFSKSDAMAIATDHNTPPAPMPPMPPKPKNPMTKWNWLLYIGSFLIVLAMIYFVDSVNDAAVAPTTIILTLIIYIAGLAITKAVGYLKPVGKAFTYSGLCMIPLWLISLNALKLPTEVVPFIVATSFSITSVIASFVLNDAFLGYVVFLSVATFIGSFAPLFFKTPTSGIVAYFLFVTPMIAALMPLCFWIKKPKWLPVALRHASMGLGKVLIPMVFISSLLLFLIPNVGVEAPFLRTVCATFFIIHCLAHWFSSKQHGYFVATRFAVQCLILAILCDSLNFSAMRMWNESINYAAALACAIVWLITFLAQVIYSLYANCDNEADKKLERAIGLISIIGIFATPILCAEFDKIPYAIVWIVICIVTAILGVLHAMRYKNVTWSLATIASIIILPIIYGVNIAKPSWGAGAYMACYSVIGLVFLFGYYALQRIQKRGSDVVGIVAISVTSAAIIATSIGANLSGVGYLIVAGLIAALAALSKQKWIYELSIYATAMSLFSFAGNVYDLAVKGMPKDFRYGYPGGSKGLEYSIALSVVRAHIIAIAFGLTTWIYERAKSSQPRLVIGYTLFTLIMSVTCTINNSLGWGILLLVEQVVALVFSVMTHRTWMTWISSIAIFLIALRLTGGFNFIWLGIVGIALIAFVIWQLSRQNKKLMASNNNPDSPNKPESQRTPITDSAQKPEETEQKNIEEHATNEKKEETTDDKKPDDSKKDDKSDEPKDEPEKSEARAEKSSDESIPEDVLWDLDNRSKLDEPKGKDSTSEE